MKCINENCIYVDSQEDNEWCEKCQEVGVVEFFIEED
jgi:hypothetical protein